MKVRIAFSFLLALVFLIVAGSQSFARSAREAGIPPVPLPVWQSEVAVAGVDLAEQGVPGMALDPDGRPHLVYGRNRLFHAWRDGASWQVETVDPNGGALTGPVIAIDDAGNITIVAYTEASRQRKELVAYSRAPGGEWQTAPIPVPSISEYPVLALALDGDGRPHVATTGSTADFTPFLLYAHASPAGWVSETIELEGNAAFYISLALDSGNRPVILYQAYDTNHQDEILWLARREASGWTHQSLAHAAHIVGSSLALDAADRAHVVFSDLEPARLVYLRQTGNGWQTRVESDTGYVLSLALDDAARPHIAYTNANEDIVYAVLGDAGWERTTIPMVGHAGSHNTLLLDANGAAHISTLQYAQGLYYATNRGGAWAAMPVAVEDPVGDRHALALDADDRPYLLYTQPSVEELRWAVKDGDTWATSLVADLSGLPLYELELAAAIGPNGVPWIAYVDEPGNALIVGTRPGGAWSLEPITTAGGDLALAVGHDNRPQLIMIQGRQLVYWTQQGGVWRSEVISPAGVDIYSAYLALDSEDTPYVVYWASDGSMVKAVRQGENDWQTETLPVGDIVVGMALGPDGSLYLLTLTFRTEGHKPPFTFYTLRLSEQVAGQWTHHDLFEDMYNGEDSLAASLVVDVNGTVHIAARDASGQLHYDRRAADGQWTSGSPEVYSGAFALAVGSDGQPRISRTLHSDLWLDTRGIVLLNQHAVLPFVPVP